MIRDGIYDLVARNHCRWFGRRNACIPPNSDRSWPSRLTPAGMAKEAALLQFNSIPDAAAVKGTWP